MTQIGDKWREFSYQSSKVLKKRKDEGLTFDDLADMLEKLGETERDFFICSRNSVRPKETSSEDCMQM